MIKNKYNIICRLYFNSYPYYPMASQNVNSLVLKIIITNKEIIYRQAFNQLPAINVNDIFLSYIETYIIYRYTLNIYQEIKQKK